MERTSDCGYDRLGGNGSNVPAKIWAPTGDASRGWPAPPSAAAFRGIAGDFVRLIQDHTESDRAAVLVQFLVSVGTLFGRKPSFMVERTRHGTNEFAVIVGASSKARKGTSLGHVESLLSAIEPTWTKDRVHSGLASGEGLVWAVRDPVYSQEPVRRNGKVESYETVLRDPGVEDKRLVVTEPELAGPLKVMRRDTNPLSGMLRQAWDGKRMENLVKSSPVSATEAHVSLIAHVTVEELRSLFDTVDMSNGFANRILWCAVRRSRLLPNGGSVPEAGMREITERLRAAALHATSINVMSRSESASRLWNDVYSQLATERQGMLGAVLSRGEAHVLRLSMIYALLDGSAVIEPTHIESAVAVWEYAERSAEFIFADLSGDVVADRILAALRAAPLGLTRTEIRDLFKRHRSEEIPGALASLLRQGMARFEMSQDTGGRPPERWFAVESPGKGAAPPGSNEDRSLLSLASPSETSSGTDPGDSR